MNIKLRKKNELQYIPGSVKELLGEGKRKKQFQRISSIKKPTTTQKTKQNKQVIQGTRVQRAVNRPNHKSKLGTSVTLNWYVYSPPAAAAQTQSSLQGVHQLFVW